MKFYLRSQRELEQELKRLMQCVRPHVPIKEKTYILADILAKSHGFVNYKSMMLCHSDKHRSVKLSRKEKNIRESVSNLSPTLLEHFNFQKRTILENEIINSFAGDYPSEIRNARSRLGAAVSNFFKTNRSLKSLFKKPKAAAPNATKSYWKSTSFIMSHDAEQLTEFYKAAPSFHACQNGGLFLLRRSIAPNVTSVIREILDDISQRCNHEESEMIINRLAVINCSSHHLADSSIIDFNPIKTQSPNDISECVLKLAADSFTTKVAQEIKEFVTGFFGALEYIYGDFEGALSQASSAELSMSLDNVVRVSLHDLMPANNRLLQYLRNLPGFSFVDAALKKPLKIETLEAHEKLLVNFQHYHYLAAEMDTKTDFSLPSIKTCIEARKIIVAVVDDDISECNPRNRILSDFILQHYLTCYDSAVIHNDLYHRPVVLDDGKRYINVHIPNNIPAILGVINLSRPGLFLYT